MLYGRQEHSIHTAAAICSSAAIASSSTTPNRHDYRRHGSSVGHNNIIRGIPWRRRGCGDQQNILFQQICYGRQVDSTEQVYGTKKSKGESSCREWAPSTRLIFSPSVSARVELWHLLFWFLRKKPVTPVLRRRTKGLSVDCCMCCTSFK